MGLHPLDTAGRKLAPDCPRDADHEKNQRKTNHPLRRQIAATGGPLLSRSVFVVIGIPRGAARGRETELLRQKSCRRWHVLPVPCRGPTALQSMGGCGGFLHPGGRRKDVGRGGKCCSIFLKLMGRVGACAVIFSSYLWKQVPLEGGAGEVRYDLQSSAPCWAGVWAGRGWAQGDQDVCADEKR